MPKRITIPFVFYSPVKCRRIFCFLPEARVARIIIIEVQLNYSSALSWAA